MTTKLEQAARQALEALEQNTYYNFDDDIKALREALAEQACPNGCDTSNGRCVDCPDYVAEQAEQEPVAWVDKERMQSIAWLKAAPEHGTKLYAAPVRTKDLTEYEIDELRFQNLNYLDFARAVIAADREKNK